MEILVCVKQVPDDEVKVSVDKASGALNISEITPVVNAFDAYALEMAVRLKEEAGGNITGVSIGGEKSLGAIRTCLSVGADRGFLVRAEDVSGIGTLPTAKILKAAVSKLEAASGLRFDIIFCGRESTDMSCGAVAAQLAELMGLGMVFDAVHAAPYGNCLSVKQETEDGYNLLKVETPCVVAVAKPSYDPRYPTMKSKIAARKAEIPVFSVEETGVTPKEIENPVKTLSVYPPEQREAGIKIQEKDAAEAAKKAAGLMREAGVL